VVTEAGGSNRRHFRDHAHGGKHTVIRILHVQPVVIESCQGTDDSGHHGHWMGVVVKSGNELIELLVDHGVIGQFIPEAVQLVFGRQFAIQKQISDFNKGASLRQLFYRVTPVTQDTFAAVDESNIAGAGCRCSESGVVG
jgi:hypothetical protein